MHAQPEGRLSLLHMQARDAKIRSLETAGSTASTPATPSPAAKPDTRRKTLERNASYQLQKATGSRQWGRQGSSKGMKASEDAREAGDSQAEVCKGVVVLAWLEAYGTQELAWLLSFRSRSF